MKARGTASRTWAVAAVAAGVAALLFWLPMPLFPGRGVSFAAVPVLLVTLWAGPWAGAGAALLALTAGWAGGTADVATTAVMLVAPLVAIVQRRTLHPALPFTVIPALVMAVDALAAGTPVVVRAESLVAMLQALLNVTLAYLLVSLRPKGLVRPVTQPLAYLLFVVLAAVAVALVTLFGAISVWGTQRQQVQGALRSVDILAHDIADSAQLLLHQESRAIYAFGRSLGVSDLARDTADLSARLAEYVKRQSNLLTILVARLDGVVVAAAEGRPELNVSAVLGSNVSDREYFRAALREGGPYVSDAFQGRSFGSDVIVAVSAPIPGPDGLVGVIEGSLNLAEIEKMLYRAGSRHGFAIALTDRTGRVVASQGSAIPGRGEPLEVPHGILSSTDWKPSSMRTLADDQWLAGTASLAEFGWSVLVMQPARVLRPAVDEQFGRVMRNLLLALAAVLLVSALLANWLGRPLRRLTEALAAGGRLAEPGLLAYLRTAPREVRSLALRLMRAQHRQAQARALRSSEARWRTMAEIAPDAVVVIGEDGRIVYANSVLRQLVGRGPGELDGQHVDVIVPPRLREGHARGFARYLMEGTRRLNWRSTEIPVQRSDGSEVVVEIAFGEYVHEGRRYFAGYLRDITVRMRQEQEARRAREAAESANRAKDIFLATMSHEIRTPLHGLIGTLELLQTQKLAGEAGRHLALARSSAEALRQIANDVLDLSAIEEGRLRVEHQPFDLRELVHAVTGGFEPAAASKGLQITARVAAAVPSRVIGDEKRLRQILSNLFNNALKFTAAGGVELRVVATVGPTVVFQVRDTGIGVPEDKRDHIFDRFAQADEAHSRYFGGVGLGLSISRLLAEAMGGRLTLAETSAEGSMFQLELPLPVAAAADDTAAAPAAAAVAQPAGPIRGARVLVVDDNSANRLVVEAYLRELGAEAVLAADADSGIAILRERSFDAVLMDIQMPGKDGYQATREIRAAFGTDIPVIAMTANTGADERVRCREAGLDDLLSKPFLMGELRDLLTSQLDRTVPAAARGAPAGPAAVQPLFDDASSSSVLRRFADRPATLRRLLSALQESLQGYLSRLEGAPAQPRDELLATLHGLKGMAAMYGAARLQAAATGLESELRRGIAPDRLAAHLQSLDATASATLAELQQRLESLES